jgi:anaerobic magnesium-protoporphyrin IX monomethyl ester cyclase
MRIALIRTYQRMMVDDLAHPLGIMALDAYLRTRGYDDIHLFDMRLRKESPAQILDRVLPLQPDVIGLSSLTIERDAIHQLTALIKARRPETITVVGGPYATSSTKTVMRDPTVDYVVVGEGELTFHDLLDTIGHRGDPADVAGILYRRDGEVVQTPPRATIQDLDALPLPSYDRIDMDAYERYPSMNRLVSGKWVVFDTSRGCPFKCTYCHDVFGKKFRARSPLRVVEDMQCLNRTYGITEFHFYDDIFNFNKKRVLEICRLIRERGLQIHMQFPNGVRADLMDLELLEAMKSAGTYRVCYAIESASPRIQKSMKKNLKIEKVRRLIDDTDRMGILQHGFFMLGFPGETRDEVLSTVQFAVESKLHSAGFYLVTPFEGSPLTQEYLQPATDMHGTDFTYYDNPHSLSEVPADEIKHIQRNAYLRFYLNPRRIWRVLQLLPRKRALFTYLPIFLKIVLSSIKIHGADAQSFDHAPDSQPWARPPMGEPDGPARAASVAHDAGALRRSAEERDVVSLPIAGQ